MPDDPKPGRSRAVPANLRRALRMRYNDLALAKMARENVDGQPCPGLAWDSDTPRPKCAGTLAYVRYALRQREGGTPVVLGSGRCGKCGAIGSVETALPR